MSFKKLPLSMQLRHSRWFWFTKDASLQGLQFLDLALFDNLQIDLCRFSEFWELCSYYLLTTLRSNPFFHRHSFHCPHLVPSHAIRIRILSSLYDLSPSPPLPGILHSFPSLDFQISFQESSHYVSLLPQSWIRYYFLWFISLDISPL